MIKTSLIYLVKFYQYLISYLITPSCRFHPSCSEYTIQALKIHGAIKGSYLGIKRILRCNPFFKGGVDFPHDN
jgi:putative membrane protein insertion efficiency factor